MVKYNDFPRGSEWRKWDLHVHTPSSIIQQYGGDNPNIWDKFIDALEKLPEEVKVIGITDYYFIDGYEKVMQYKKQGRLSNIEKIFPILEFRIDTFGSGNENKLQKINLHILFDVNEEKLDSEIQKIKDEFIKQIPITKLEKHKTKMLTKDNLIGEAGSLERGFSSFIPPTDTVFNLIFSETWKNKVFLFLGYKEWSNLDKNSQLQPFKEDLYNKVHVFLSSNFNTITKSQEWLNEFGNKRLLHSLDIHSFEQLDSYNCNTWIKADPTFEGLKQIIYEPEDRVKIQEEKPEQKYPYNVIDCVQFVDDENTFTDEMIYLNQNLNAIIGGKSTGKSILLREIARAINPSEVENKLREVGLEDYKKEAGKDFKVKWIDGRNDKRNDVSKDYRKIIYVPQSYLNRLSDREEEQSPIDKLVENILKEEDSLKQFFEDLQKKINENNGLISNGIERLFENIQKNKELLEETKNIGDKEGIDSYIKQIESEIKKLQEKGGASKDDIENYSAFIEKREKLSEELQNLKLKKKDFESIKGIGKFTFSNDFERIASKYKSIKSEADHLIESIESNFDSYLKNEIIILSNEIEEKEKNLNKIDKQIKSMSEKVENTKQIDKKIKIRKNETNKLRQILRKEEEIENKKKDIDYLVDSLSKYFVKFYEIKNEFKTNLENNSHLSNDLDLEVVVNAKNKQFEENFIDNVFDRRSLSDIYKSFKFNLDNAKRLEDQIKSIISDILKGSIKLKSQYEDEKKEIIQKLLKDWFVINYRITYDEDTISEMSPGKKSFVLLRLIVELDKSRCPLLIDQPEDDLDNRSVYNEVAKFLRAKKKERQIIIVTHNPNLVVTTDAECIIVANQDGEKTKNKKFKFEYVQGALECSFVKEAEEKVLYKQGIKEHTCEILEGGIEAFKNREKKYFKGVNHA